MEFREIFNIFKKKAVPVAAAGAVAATVVGAEASQPVIETPNPTPAVVQESQAPSMQNPVASQGVEVTFPTESPVVTPSEAPVITPSPEPSTPAPTLVPPIEQTPMPSPTQIVEPSFASPTLIPPIEQTPMPSPNETASEPLPDTSSPSQPAETPKP